MSTRAMGRGLLGGIGVVALVACTVGCASLAKAPASAPPPTASTPVPSPGTSAPKPGVSATRSDSLPSADAERVLATIPEPLSPSQQVAPDSTKPRAIPAPEAAYDTLRAQTQGESTSIPVPAPTPVVAAPVVTFAPPESTSRAVPVSPAPATAAPATTAPATTAPATTAPATTAPAAPEAAAGAASAPASGPCWRVQVAAPATRAEAESRLEAAQSLLVVKMTIVSEKGLFKVRTSDCMTRDVADSVKRRALDSGFDGSFLVDTAAASKPAAPKKHAASGAH